MGVCAKCEQSFSKVCASTVQRVRKVLRKVFAKCARCVRKVCALGEKCAQSVRKVYTLQVCEKNSIKICSQIDEKCFPETPRKKNRPCGAVGWGGVPPQTPPGFFLLLYIRASQEPRYNPGFHGFDPACSPPGNFPIFIKIYHVITTKYYNYSCKDDLRTSSHRKNIAGQKHVVRLVDFRPRGARGLILPKMDKIGPKLRGGF